ncbi:MAG: cytochrome b5 domain-containing protein [Elusimicrobiota bacterium]|nr:cytochrome b5 domain-containing protein [Elusimicrobiota bacterium]
MKILTALLLTALLSGGAAAEEQKKAADGDAWKARVFTSEELKKYNGKDGMPAYAAVDGIVYDLSKSKYWKAGGHMKMHEAGADLSSAMHNQAPKGTHKDGKILEKMPKVGVLEGYGKERTAAAPPAAKSTPEAAPQEAAKSPLAALHKVTKEEIGLDTSCPVTGEKIKVSEKTPALDFKGKTYYFSGLDSMAKFGKDPGKALTEKVKGLFKKKKS